MRINAKIEYKRDIKYSIYTVFALTYFGKKHIYHSFIHFNVE
jgi:hypothetical protein